MSKVYPVLPVVMPADIKNCENGKLPDSVMRPLQSYPKGKLHRNAATAYNCLNMAAYFANISLSPVSPTDCYRNAEIQTKIFFERYQLENNGSKVTRQHDGKTWYLKPGKAPCSAPQKSNHGWGLAVDIANCSGARLDWLLGDGGITSNALRFGFTWETTPASAGHEDWHIRYICGDVYPPGVVETLKVFPGLEAK